MADIYVEEQTWDTRGLGAAGAIAYVRLLSGKAESANVQGGPPSILVPILFMALNRWNALASQDVGDDAQSHSHAPRLFHVQAVRERAENGSKTSSRTPRTRKRPRDSYYSRFVSHTPRPRSYATNVIIGGRRR